MNIKELSDIELLKLLSTDKKERAFGVLVDRYRTFVLKKCKRFLKNSSEAEDLTQEIFMKVENKYATFKGNSSFKTWLYAITYRECLLFLREAKKVTFKSVNLEELKEEYNHIDIEIDIDIETNRNLDLLNKIDPLEKALLLMKYMEGMKIRTIATTLDLGESNVKMRLKRAKSRLLKLRSQQ